MFDVSDSSNDESIIQQTSKGVRVSGSNTSSKILSQLPDSGRGWYILKPNDYPTELRTNSYLKIFNKKGRSETRGSRSDRDYIYVFEKLRPVGSGTGGGGGVSDKGKSNNLDICAMCVESSGSQLNTDPAVFITVPKKDSIVVRGSVGVEADGSAYDSKSVALSWAGGSEGKDISNDTWKITLPIGAGEHELTAAVEGDTKSVKFTVVLKPAITGYTAEQIQALKTYSNNANISEVEQDADSMAREAGLKETTDDYAGFAICRKVNDFATKASGDFSLFYSGSGDKAFIEKKIDRIFGAHLSDSKKAELISKLEGMKTAGFVDATDAFHDAMKNTLDIFFAENSIGKTISEMNVPIGVNPAMILVMDAAKTVVNIKLNIQLGSESNGAPLLMHQEARRNAFDAIAVEVTGAAVGGVVVKAGSKAFKVIKSFFKKFEYKFNKSQKPKITSDSKVIPLGKTEADAILIQMPKGVKKGKFFTKDGVTIKYDNDGFPIFKSKFDTFLSKKHIGSGKPGEHFKASNEDLRDALKKDPKLAKKMGLSDKQVTHFMKDPAVQKPPKGLTWHHHQDTGKMQLVKETEHAKMKPHTGGMSIWGGGYPKKGIKK